MVESRKGFAPCRQMYSQHPNFDGFGGIKPMKFGVRTFNGEAMWV